jgi:hypothetical protein
MQLACRKAQAEARIGLIRDCSLQFYSEPGRILKLLPKESLIINGSSMRFAEAISAKRQNTKPEIRLEKNSG